MPVTERVMKPGSWSLKFRPDVPQALLDALDYFGHVVITSAHVNAAALGDAGMKSAAQYVGIVRERRSHIEVGGAGLLAWLGDENGRGRLIETAKAYTAASFHTVVAGLLDGLPAGTIANPGPGSALTYSFLYMTPRAALDYAMAWYGGEYRMRPDGTIDADTVANLYPTSATPTVVVLARSGGRDLNVVGIPASQLDIARDIDDYLTGVELEGGNGYGLATVATSYKDWQGNTVRIDGFVKSSGVAPGQEQAAAQAILATALERKAVTLATTHSNVRGDVAPGDYIYVHDRDSGLYDTTNQVRYRGSVLFPVKVRVYAVTWPIEDGFGVYYRNNAGAYTDLTPWIAWETGNEAQLEVGAPARQLTSTTGAAGTSADAPLNARWSAVGYRNAALSMSAGGNEIALDAFPDDPQGMLTGGYFTAPFAGVWHFDFQTRTGTIVTSAADTSVQLCPHATLGTLLANGTIQVACPVGSTPAQAGSATLKLAKGATVALVAYTSTAQPLYVAQGAGNNFLAVELVAAT